MPQLTPFFFLNEVTYLFIIIPALLYFNGKYILSYLSNVYTTRHKLIN